MPKHAALIPFVEVRLSSADARPLYRQLYDALRAAILAGHLAAGTQLPSTRTLASQLGVSRFTVVNAFEQLLAEGFLHGQIGSGTFVSTELPGVVVRAAGTIAAPAAGPRPRLSRRGELLASTRLTPVAEEGRPRAFRPGQPALDQFPAVTWARLAARLYRHAGPALLTYGDIAGYRPLREAIASYLRVARAVACEPEQVIVVSGSQQALDLAVHILLDPGEAAWVEDPGYPGARAALQSAGATMVPVPVDAEGLDVALGVAAQPDARLAYVTPSYQYPLGVTMSLARRLALLEWARQAGAWVLEDDYDSEFRYSGHPLAALAGLDTAGHVIYMGSFSKVLFPALRLGYLVVPPAAVDAFVSSRALAGRHAPTLEQAVLAEFIAEGHFARHIRNMRMLYQERQAILVAAASGELSGLLDVPPSPAGMHLVGWLVDSTASDQAASDWAAREGIEARALSTHALRAPMRPGLMLGYTALQDQEIRAGVSRLARALRLMRAGERSGSSG
jgi:GntR family transcriptional regulator/MocR family aminotransferase